MTSGSWTDVRLANFCHGGEAYTQTPGDGCFCAHLVGYVRVMLLTGLDQVVHFGGRPRGATHITGRLVMA